MLHEDLKSHGMKSRNHTEWIYQKSRNKTQKTLGTEYIYIEVKQWNSKDIENELSMQNFSFI